VLPTGLGNPSGVSGGQIRCVHPNDDVKQKPGPTNDNLSHGPFRRGGDRAWSAGMKPAGAGDCAIRLDLKATAFRDIDENRPHAFKDADTAHPRQEFSG